MRFTTVAIASAVVAVASAQTLDPLYPFQPNGACVDACLNVRSYSNQANRSCYFAESIKDNHEFRQSTTTAAFSFP